MSDGSSTRAWVISFGPFRVAKARRQVERDGVRIQIGSRAFDILAHLLEHPGEVVSHRALLAVAWPDTNVEEGNLRFQMAMLRQALGGGNNHIINVPGRGYCFVAAISREADGAEFEDSGVPVRLANALPPALGRMVGRDDTVREICLNVTEKRFVTIVGPGGMGKSTVAVSVAHQLLNDFQGAVCFVELSPLSDPHLLAGTVASAFGLAVQARDPTPELIAYLRDKRTLLVLDGSEHLISEVANLSQRLFEELRELHLLATSREALRAEGEYIYRLSPLASPPEKGNLSIAETLAFPAPQLFVARMVSGGQSAEFSAEEARLIGDMCRKLGGIALAIELAAGRVEAYGIGETAKLLDSQFALLWPGRRTAPPRHQTLSATLDWSYKLLSDIERSVLRRFSVFVGSFTLEAALKVVGGPDFRNEEVFNAIGGLVAKSLVAADISGVEARYRLLDTTRAYAIEKLNESGERERIARLHAEHYLAHLKHAEVEGLARPAAAWLADDAMEIDNLRAALDWAFSLSGDASLAVALTTAAVPLWLRLSLLEECGSRARQALSVLTTLGTADPHQEMRLHTAVGASSPDASEMAAAYRRVLDIAETLCDLEHQLRALRGLYFYSAWTIQFRAQMSFAQQFHDLAASGSNQSDQLVGERMLGTVKYVLGDLAGARRHLEQALAGYSATDPRQAAVRFDDVIRFQHDGQVEACVFLSGVLWLQGFAHQALRMAEKSVAAAEAIGHGTSQCLALALGTCTLALWTGDLGAAADYTRMLVDLSTRNGDSPWAIYGARFRRVIALRGGSVGSIAEVGQSDAHLRNLACCTELADALAKAGRRAEGLAVLDSFETQLPERGAFTPEFLRVRGELLLLQTAPAFAKPSEDFFRQALDVARQHGALSLELRAATSLARLLRNQGHQAEAIVCLQPVYDRFTEGFATADLIAAKQLLDDLDLGRS